MNKIRQYLGLFLLTGGMLAMPAAGMASEQRQRSGGGTGTHRTTQSTTSRSTTGASSTTSSRSRSTATPSRSTTTTKSSYSTSRSNSGLTDNNKRGGGNHRDPQPSVPATNRGVKTNANSVSTKKIQTTTQGMSGVSVKPGGNRPGGNHGGGNVNPGGNRPGGNHGGGNVNPGGNRPGGNHGGGNVNPGGNRPGGNHGGSNVNPGGNRPGGNHGGNHYRPGGNRPGGNSAPAPGTGSRPPHVQRPPHFSHPPHPDRWSRPLPPPPPPPRYTYRRTGVPVINAVLNLNFGTPFDIGLSMLYNSGYNIVGTMNNMICLQDVVQFGMTWPQTTIIYNNNIMSGARFQYASTSSADYRFRSVYKELCMLYGNPIELKYNGGFPTATWWGGDCNGYITLSFGPNYNNFGQPTYYTDLVYGYQ